MPAFRPLQASVIALAALGRSFLVLFPFEPLCALGLVVGECCLFPGQRAQSHPGPLVNGFPVVWDFFGSLGVN